MNVAMNSKSRLLWLDYLRFSAVCLVAVLHVSLCYVSVAPAWWYVREPHENMALSIVAALLNACTMPILFWVAGYSAGLEQCFEGIGQWTAKRARRLLLPWLFGVLLLAPLLMWAYHLSRQQEIHGLADVYQIAGKLHAGHFWFLPVLYILGACVIGMPKLHVGMRACLAQGRTGILLFLAVECVAYALLASLFGVDSWWHGLFLGIQPARLALYFSFYLLGIAEAKNEYAPSRLLAWVFLSLMAALLYLSGLGGEKPVLCERLGMVLFSYCMLRMLTALCLRLEKRQNLVRWLFPRKAMAVYLLHPVIVVFGALALRSADMPYFIKFAILLSSALVLPCVIDESRQILCIFLSRRSCSYLN
jgi:hypothetical protein